MRLTDIPNFDKMSDLHLLGLDEELIISVRDPSVLSVPMEQRLELERRWAQHKQNPGSALSQEVFWAKVQALKS